VPSDEEISTWKKEFKNKDLNAQHVSWRRYFNINVSSVGRK
jgi:hypothetical protein